MNPNLILGWLQSESSIVRIRAARRLVKEKHGECLDALRIAYQTEEIPWVKNAFSQALSAYEEERQSGSSEHRDQEFGEDDIPFIESQAISDSIGQVLHELEPAIGQLRVVAREVVASFDGSALKHEFEKLDELLETFENWRTVEQRPTPRTVKVREVINEVTSEVDIWSDSAIDLQVLTTEEIEIVTDLQLLRIIVSNALRNAVEATIAIGNGHPVTVSYGLTNTSFWISINDRGIGLPPNQSSFLKSTTSTKPGHRGMGLAIVDKAVQAIKGNWDLKNGPAGGAEFYLEIPKSIQ